MMRNLAAGRIVLAAAIVLGAWCAAGAAGPTPAEGSAARSRGNGQSMGVHDLFDHLVDVAAGAADEDSLRALLENDHLVMERGLIFGSDITAGSVSAGDCYPSPLVCLLKWYTPDLRCVYDCIGLRGRGEISRQQLEECDFLVGCLLFENCLALCISIIPGDRQPVIWW